MHPKRRTVPNPAKMLAQTQPLIAAQVVPLLITRERANIYMLERIKRVNIAPLIAREPHSAYVPSMHGRAHCSVGETSLHTRLFASWFCSVIVSERGDRARLAVSQNRLQITLVARPQILVIHPSPGFIKVRVV